MSGGAGAVAGRYLGRYVSRAVPLARSLAPKAVARVQRTAAAPAVRRASVTANRAAGNHYRDQLAGHFRAHGYQVRTEVYKRTPFGRRYIDIEVSRAGRVLGGIETKVGRSRYTPAQRAKDRYLWLRYRYRVNVVRWRR